MGIWVEALKLFILFSYTSENNHTSVVIIFIKIIFFHEQFELYFFKLAAVELITLGRQWELNDIKRNVISSVWEKLLAQTFSAFKYYLSQVVFFFLNSNNQFFMTF